MIRCSVYKNNIQNNEKKKTKKQRHTIIWTVINYTHKVFLLLTQFCLFLVNTSLSIEREKKINENFYAKSEIRRKILKWIFRKYVCWISYSYPLNG